MGEREYLEGLRYEDKFPDDVTPDLKPERRIIDRALMRLLHQQWRECVLCGESAIRLSLHHVWNKPRHDVRENLVMLCGSGTTGCHGKITVNNVFKLRELGRHILTERPDIVGFITRMKRGDAVAADEWIRSTFRVDEILTARHKR